MAKRVTLTVIQSGQHYSETILTNHYTLLNQNFDNFLHLNGVGESGNTMLGNLDMGGLRILNVSAPSVSGDVATKAYVDAASLLAATGTVVGSEVDDADGDTGIQSEATADLDRLDLFAASSGGAENALEVIGDDGTAASLVNPYIKLLKHVMLDTGVRIGDAAVANTYMELNRSGSADHIFLVAGGNNVLEIDSTSMLVSQDILLYDAGATAAGKKIGDQDGDTYIQFNQATGGTDDDTIRFYANGSQVLAVGASGLSDLVALRVENMAIGIDLPGSSENHNIILTTGVVNSAANMQDNTVVVYSSVVSGIENALRIDIKRSGPAKVTIVLGYNCILPNNLTVAGDVTISGTTTSSSKDTGALIVEGGVGVEEDVYAGGQVVAPNVIATTQLQTDVIIEQTGDTGVTIDGTLIKNGGATLSEVTLAGSIVNAPLPFSHAIYSAVIPITEVETNINTSTNQLTSTAHTFASATTSAVPVKFTQVTTIASTDAPQIIASTILYVKVIDSNIIELYREEGLINIVEFSDDGTGDFTLTPQWIPPTGITKVWAGAFGSGGGGGDGGTTIKGGGGGGSAGGEAWNFLTVTPGTAIAMLVGAGGAKGVDGNTTTFSSLIGAAGLDGEDTASQAGAAGGLGVVSTGGAFSLHRSQPGQTGGSTTAAANDGQGGAGGSTSLGGGGAHQTAGQDGTGGGGGGGDGSTSSNKPGGDGCIIIWY